MENDSILIRKERIEGSSKNITPRSFDSQVAGGVSLLDKLSLGKFKIYADYLEWLGLAKDPNLLILSPTHHYYYDDEDLKGVTTIINLKHLNFIKDERHFMETLYQMLPVGSFFISSFIDKRNRSGLFSNTGVPERHVNVDSVENGISSRIPLLNILYDFIDSRTNNRNLTGRSVKLMLENTGMKVLDMSEISGITFFCAQKVLPGKVE